MPGQARDLVGRDDLQFDIRMPRCKIGHHQHQHITGQQGGRGRDYWTSEDNFSSAPAAGQFSWTSTFDANPARAAQSRQAMFREVAADRIPVLGMHLPFPGAGTVVEKGDGYELVAL